MALLEYYRHQLEKGGIPSFLFKYLNTSSMVRLQKIDYFCGMKYASKDIYDFKENISRFDHSLTVALMTWKLTYSRVETIAALYHDVATPCFSHVIDYMNNDYEYQESTEEYTEEIIKNDKELLACLAQDSILPESIINYKNYSIVDNKRPMLCADRLDGIILTAISWTKNISLKDIIDILSDIKTVRNENFEYEISFENEGIARRVFEINEVINHYCHSNEDSYMMNLLAKITALAIEKKFFSYKDLYILNEEQLMTILDNCNDCHIQNLLYKFKNIKRNEITETEIENLKVRSINPLVRNKRLY